ncbi:amidohydrolase [Thorsellia anophelis]|uniref:Amidohydrolase n=1 Tax=Thorsellia anophelis DSM 18579 TaxID=1123402 RepID=A0A1I0DZ86_9GAMM|nr:amidohydrolase [Thorsellia anophelis]SET38067.1 amidohydrolase [Thorsellia anophelis DSM 18579]
MRLAQNETIAKEILAFRLDMHQYPELSNQEFKTTQKIKDALSSHGIEIGDYELKTGLVAVIKGEQAGPVIALRGDIDALPITEETGSEYRSKVNGVMHACGHDFHTSAVLGAAILLNQNRTQIKGEIRIIFQSAEETGLGAPEFIKAGVIDNVSAIFGIHNDPMLPIGIVGSKSGALTAGVDRFEVVINAKGAHAAKPHEGNDPIIILGQIITTLQTIISRKVASNENAVVSITEVRSGNTWNVIPDSAYIQGTVRTFNPSVRAQIETEMRTILSGFAIVFHADIELKWHAGPPSVMNTDYLVEYALSHAKANQFEPQIVEASPIGEDFAFFQEQVPGAFLMIGTSGQYPLHHPKFSVNDAVLYPTAHYLAEIVLNAYQTVK